MASFKVHGLVEMGRKLRTLPDDLQRTVLRDSVDGMAQIVENEAESLAPRRTGKLKRNISRVRQRPKRDREQVNVGVRRRVYYWKFQELGSARNAAHPFLRPAASGKAKDALNEFRKRFAAGLLRAATK
jgi:HK97 gp10 family phage protein